MATDTSTTAGTVVQERPLPDRVTMPLLTLVTREAVDEDYVQAARRRAASAPGAPPRRTTLRGAAVVTVLFGLLVALAAVRTARNADVREASRDALTARIDERRAGVDGLEERIGDLRRTNADLSAKSARLRRELEAAQRQVEALQVSTGFVAVSGPGLRITVTDSADGEPSGRVRASDLRRLVNGLWLAGADAVAVNGRRLSAASAIAQSNIAIQVNRGPLTPPYVISAIGGPDLGSRLDASSSGVQFQSLADQFGFGVDRQDEAELRLPAAPESQLRLRYAERVGGSPDRQEDAP